MRLYTKTGDGGTTGLVGGDRVAKDDPRIEAVGALDELNAALGVAILHVSPARASELTRIQSLLFDVGAEIACPPDGLFQMTSVDAEDVAVLERAMDDADGELPPLKAFILPGGTPGSAHLHLARTVCRRAERTVVTLSGVSPVRDDVARFLNRLSDRLFSAARQENLAAGIADVPWKKKS